MRYPREIEGFISDSCSNGTQLRTVSCRRSDGAAASASACPTTKPPESQTCKKTTGCQWYQVGPWTACSTKCGTGEQTRTVTCKTADGTRDALESLCPGPKPPTRQACTDRTGCEKEWNVSAWSDCVCPTWSRYEGTRSRTVTCPTAGDGICNNMSKPHESERCACPGTWDWENVGECNCGANGQTCSSTGWCKGQRQELKCPAGSTCGPRPTEWVRYVDCRCTPPPPPTIVPNAQWHVTPWTRCDCNTNTRTRTVYCPPGYNCGPTPTISTREMCPDAVRVVDCPVTYMAWQYDQWSACDCRTRKQYRRVYCPELNKCDPNTKPRDEERDGDCAARCSAPPPAASGYWSQWTQCDCTTNTQRRTYICPANGICEYANGMVQERVSDCPIKCYVSNYGITNTNEPRCTDPNNKVNPVGDWLMSQWSACKQYCATEPGKQDRVVCKTGTGIQPITLRNTLNCIQECSSR